MIDKIFLFLRKILAEYGKSVLIGAFLGFVIRFFIDNPGVFLVILFAMFPIFNFILLSLSLWILLLPSLGVLLEIVFQFI